MFDFTNKKYPFVSIYYLVDSPSIKATLGTHKNGLNWRMAVIEGVEITDFKKEKGKSGIFCVALTGGWL